MPHLRAETVVCPTCSASVGQECSKRFPDWDETIPHETRTEKASSPRIDIAASTVDFQEETPSDAARRINANALYGKLGVPKTVDELAERVDASKLASLRRIALGKAATKARPVMRRRIARYIGFPTHHGLEPGMTAQLVIRSQIESVRPTHLFVVPDFENFQGMLTSFRTGNREHIENPVPLSDFRPVSDYLIEELSKTHKEDTASLIAALDAHCRMETDSVPFGHQVLITIQSLEHERQVDIHAALRVETIERVL